MKKKKYIYKNHPEHKDTFEYVNKPDGYIINGLFYKDKDAVGNKVPRDIFIPIPVYFEPPDIIDIVGKCANCGVEFNIHKNNSNNKKEVAGISDMKVLAEMIEGMSYEQHPKLFKELAKRYKDRSRSDWKERKIQLSIRGKAIAQLLKYCYIPANEMWQISKPFMEYKK